MRLNQTVTCRVYKPRLQEILAVLERFVSASDFSARVPINSDGPIVPILISGKWVVVNAGAQWAVGKDEITIGEASARVPPGLRVAVLLGLLATLRGLAEDHRPVQRLITKLLRRLGVKKVEGLDGLSILENGNVQAIASRGKWDAEPTGHIVWF